MNLKISTRALAALMIIGIVGATAGAGTLAYFSDTETSQDNVFTAGELDLKVDWTEHYNNAEQNPMEVQPYTDNPGAIFELGDVKPGDNGEATVSLHVFDNPGWVWMNATPRDYDDNGCNDPESEVDGDCGDDEGELQEAVNLHLWYDDGDNVHQSEERTVYEGPVDELHLESNYNYLKVNHNSGFENPEVTDSAGWDVFPASSVPGWDVEWNSNSGPSEDPACSGVSEPQLEFHRGVLGWTPHGGEQYVELDTDCQGPGSGGGEKASVTISQTVPGRTYEMSYYYSPRPGHADNELEVAVDGTVEATHSVSGSGNSDTDWTENTVTFTATDSTTTISFTETGAPDSMGMFLDDVVIREKYGVLTSGIQLDGDTSTNITDEFMNSTDHYLGLSWSFPSEAGNLYQSDSLMADLSFYVEQRRHNDHPMNPWN